MDEKRLLISQSRRTHVCSLTGGNRPRAKHTDGSQPWTSQLDHHKELAACCLRHLILPTEAKGFLGGGEASAKATGATNDPKKNLDGPAFQCIKMHYNA